MLENKMLEFGQDSRDAIMRGVTKLSRAVRATLGPRGRNVVIERKMSAPHVTKDGVTVASEIKLRDPFENMGAQMIKQVASKTADAAGDGTSTATVLAEAMLFEGLKMVAAGHDPMSIKRGIDKVVTSIVEELKEQSRAVDGSREIEQIATISANGESSIGALISEAMEAVGKDGFITLEEGQLESRLDISQGYEFDRGYLDPIFCTNYERMRVEFENPLIWLVDGKISSQADLDQMMPILQHCGKSKIPLVIIAESIEGEPLMTLGLNASPQRNTLQCVAIRAPGFGDRRSEMLGDMAAFTGATLRNGRVGEDLLADVDLGELGTADRIVVTKEKTAVIGPSGSDEAIEERLGQISAIIDDCESDHEREMHVKRKARLAGGVAVIRVGAATEVEMKERRDRFDDALSATRAAVQEGVVPGGGVALVRAVKAHQNFTTGNIEEDIGVLIALKACCSPLKYIAENAGETGDVVVTEVRDRHEGAVGFNAAKRVYEDLFEAGIIDPVKVTRVALQNAASVAGLMLTTECTIAFEPEEKPNMSQGMGM